MKKLISLLLALAMLATLAACGGSGGDTTPSTDPPATDTQPSDSQNATDGETTGTTPSDESTVRVEEDEPQYGGSVTLYVSDMYTYFDPAMDENKNYCLWLENLWTMDWSINDPEVADFASNTIRYTEMSGQIAESWDDLETFLANGYLDVTIRDDIKFQTKTDAQYDVFGGRQLKASDVAYSYNRLLGANGVPQVSCETDWASQLFMLDPAKCAEAIDDFTVRFYFTTVTESALDTFITRPINISGPEWDDLTTEQQGDWHYACGTGPYLLTDFVADNYYGFTRNENYYDYDERYPENKLPYIDSVKMIYLKDTATLTTQFLAGELDWFDNNFANLSSSELTQLRDMGSFVEMQFPTSSGGGITFKCALEPWNNIEVRSALQKAINLDEIFHEYLGYTGDYIVPAMFSTNTPEWVSYQNWSDELRAEYAYDPEAAAQMLDEAGYPAGSDGIRFVMNVQISGMDDSVLYDLIQSYLAAVGVDMQITVATDMMAVISNESDRETNLLPSGSAGQIVDIGMASVFCLPGGGRYAIMDEDSEASAEFVGLFDQIRAATYLEDQAEIAQQLDVLFAEQHWVLVTSPYKRTSEFWSERMHGYTSEQMAVKHNRMTMVARLWVVD